MLVCINSHFKIPVAYYFINALSGVEKSNLTKEILFECHTHSIDVRNMSFDDASSNISMENLGAEIYDSTSTASFNDSANGKLIYTSPDAGHMLKLIRNTEASTDITDNDNQVISWKYLQALVDCQENEGLHLATKIRRRHIQFQNEKMKVNLVVQTLSSSVAAALEICETDLDLKKFGGTSATARFCKIVNDCFDLLNSKNRFNKNSGKAPISRENLEEMKIRVDASVNYMKNLKINNISVLKSNKRTEFLGFIISLRNAVKLAEDLFLENKNFSFSCSRIIYHRII